MESEGRAGFLQVAKDCSFDIGANLRAHSGRSIHVSFKVGEGVDEGKRARAATREHELDNVPVDTLWISEAGIKLQTEGAHRGKQRSYEGREEAAGNDPTREADHKRSSK